MRDDYHSGSQSLLMCRYTATHRKFRIYELNQKRVIEVNVTRRILQNAHAPLKRVVFSEACDELFRYYKLYRMATSPLTLR